MELMCSLANYRWHQSPRHSRVHRPPSAGSRPRVQVAAVVTKGANYHDFQGGCDAPRERKRGQVRRPEAEARTNLRREMTGARAPEPTPAGGMGGEEHWF